MGYLTRILSASVTLAVTLFVFVLVSAGQKVNNNWVFGYHGGLNFNTDPPTPFTQKVLEADSPPFYTSSISDKNGNLLFFTNGIKVWNSKFREFSIKDQKWPWLDKIDEVTPLICQYPGNDSLYYIFGISRGKNSAFKNNLIAITIDSRSNAGLGAIRYPDPLNDTNYYTLLNRDCNFYLAGTLHCNQKDTWLTTISGNTVLNYLVSAAGILPMPGTTLPFTAQDFDNDQAYSNIKFSANGEKLVIPVVSRNKILVYDFNTQTGAFSSPVIISVPVKEYLEDIELSPDGKLLYCGTYEDQYDGIDPTGIELHNIFQYDLTLGSAAAMEQSRFKLNDFPDRGGCPKACYIIHRSLNLAPDGKIYVSLRDVPGLPLDKGINAVLQPNKKGVDAFYKRNYLYLGVVYKFINYNYIKSGSFSIRENGIQVNKKICLGLPTDFSLLYKVDSVKWNFGDPSSGAQNNSDEPAPRHVYSSVGNYLVKAILYKDCLTDTSSVTVEIKPDPIVKIPDYITDTTVCVGSSLYIDAKTPAATTYSWNDGLIYSYREITKAGSFIVRANNECSLDQRAFTVKFEECPCNVFVPNAFTPNRDGLNDIFKPSVQCAVLEYSFQVYSRYGNRVFFTNDQGKGWTGYSNNIPLATGTYVWMVTFKNPNTKKTITQYGVVTLLR